MSKNAFLLVFLGLAALLSQNCLAGALAELGQADVYAQSEDYQRAEAAYTAVVTNYPGTDEALEAQRGLTILYLQQDDWQQAQAAYDELVTSFSENEQLPRSAWDIAEYCWFAGEYDRAVVFYEDVVEYWPTHEKALSSQKDVVQSYISIGNYAAAESALANLTSEFGDSEGVVDAVINIAERYRKYDQLQKCSQTYRDAVESWFANRSLDYSQILSLGGANAAFGNDSAATICIEKLETTFSSDPNGPKGVCHIVGKYYDAGRYDKVLEHLSDFTEQWPGNKAAVGVQKDLVMAHLLTGDWQVGKAATAKLLTDFSQDENLDEALYYLARNYISAHFTGRAEIDDVLPSLTDQQKEEDFGVLLQVTSAVDDFESGIDIGASIENFDGLVTQLSGELASEWYSGTAVSQIAESYYNEAVKHSAELSSEQVQSYLEKAIDTWQQLDNLPGYIERAMACMWMGDCYRRLGDYPKSIEQYQKVVDNYPNYDLVWDASCQVGRNYEKMVKARLMSKSEGNPKIRTAYEQLIAQYPDCKAARVAGLWLDRHNTN